MKANLVVPSLSPSAIKSITNHFIGFDEMFDVFEKAVGKMNDIPNYPPRNIIRYDENSWEVQFAVAGFSREDLTVTIERDVLLIVAGKTKPLELPEGAQVLRKEISAREFRHEITIPEDSEVGVELVDGLLKVKIVKPVAKKPEPKLLEIK